MKQDLLHLIFQMSSYPSQGRDPIGDAKRIFLLKYCPGGNVVDFVLDSIHDARETKDDAGLQASMILGFSFEVYDNDDRFVRVFSDLITDCWHFMHEDIVSALEAVGSVGTLPALERAAYAKPPYLYEVDEAKTLASKAIWAIWKNATTEAEALLLDLANSQDLMVRGLAQSQLGLTKRSE